MLLKIYKEFALIPESEKIKNEIPIFATPEYADYFKLAKKAITVWFTYENDLGMYYLIPFSVSKKFGFKRGVFQTAVIQLQNETKIELERNFLNEIVKYIRSFKLCDWIEESPNWAIFNTYPSHATVAPFGTLRVILKDKSENELYKGLHGNKRNIINKTIRKGEIEIVRGQRCFNDSIILIQNTFNKAGISGFSRRRFELLNKMLGENCVVMSTYYNNVPQSTCVFLYNSFAAYGYWAGSKEKAVNGATSLLFWESLKECKSMDLVYFDFVGARINPDLDSKIYRIQQNKLQYGAQLFRGYIWKLPIHKSKYILYKIIVYLVRFLRLKKVDHDIIDQENQFKKNNRKI